LHYVTYRGPKSDFFAGIMNSDFREAYPAIQWDGNWSEDNSATDFEAVSCPEIVVFADDRSEAQKAMRLMEAAYVLVYDMPDFLDRLFLAIPDDQKEFEDFKGDHQLGPNAFLGGGCAPGFCLAAWIAAKASHKRHVVYALMKYLLSKRTCFVDLMATDPAKRANVSAEKDLATHVAFTNAIIQAYGVIEELRFAVKASDKKPATINGKWNPEVKQDLTARLVRGRIDLADHETWIVHGPSREIDRKQSHRTGPKARWASGAVSDMELAVEDAIARASFLRSKVSSHKLGRWAASLTVLDVANVQFLARRLPLEHLGALRYTGMRRRRSRPCNTIVREAR
jgi:hypothetical protein